jgi:hypothetical protein
MTRLRVPVVAAVLFLACLAAPALATSQTGDEDSGTFTDASYMASLHYVHATWCDRSGCSDGEERLTGVVNVNSMADYNGHNVCVQVAFDWHSPSAQTNHYDIRVIRNCDPNSDYSKTYTESDNRFCGSVTGLPIRCTMPMRRIQIARYVPATNSVVGPKECRLMFGSDPESCDGWNPTCEPDSCQGFVRQRNGTVAVIDGGNPTDPSGKRKG